MQNLSYICLTDVTLGFRELIAAKHIWQCTFEKASSKNGKDGAVSAFSTNHNKTLALVTETLNIFLQAVSDEWGHFMKGTSRDFLVTCASVGLLGSQKFVHAVAGSRGVLL